MSRYLQGAWFQVDDEQNVTAISSKPCSEVYPEGTVEDVFYQQIQFMKCPDTDDPIKLKNRVQQSKGEYKSYTYYFLVDTC